jgi:hypothetical protein
LVDTELPRFVDVVDDLADEVGGLARAPAVPHGARSEEPPDSGPQATAR